MGLKLISYGRLKCNATRILILFGPVEMREGKEKAIKTAGKM